jgi:flavin-dependent dehydrogenase
LLDRASFPRHKLCGDTINPGALAILRRLGLGADVERTALPVHGMVVTGAGGVEIRGEYPRGVHGLSVRRHDLDWVLLQRAMDAGVDLYTGVTVRAPILDEARVVGIRASTSRGSNADFKAPLTIAADGRRSCLAFGLGLARHPAGPRRWAIGAYFEGGSRDVRFGEMHIRSNAYLGVAPVPDGLTNACLVCCPQRGDFADPASLLGRVLAHDGVLAPRFARARMVGRPSVLGPLAVDTSAAGMPGLLLVGDAAGFVDPMTGDGLRFVFEGAELTAAHALAALEGRMTDPAAALSRRRAAAFRRKWRLNRALRALVASPSAVSAATLSARLWPGAVRALVSMAGDVPPVERHRGT